MKFFKFKRNIIRKHLLLPKDESDAKPEQYIPIILNSDSEGERYSAAIKTKRLNSLTEPLESRNEIYNEVTTIKASKPAKQDQSRCIVIDSDSDMERESYIILKTEPPQSGKEIINDFATIKTEPLDEITTKPTELEQTGLMKIRPNNDEAECYSITIKTESPESINAFIIKTEPFDDATTAQANLMESDFLIKEEPQLTEQHIDYSQPFRKTTNPTLDKRQLARHVLRMNLQKAAGLPGRIGTGNTGLVDTPSNLKHQKLYFNTKSQSHIKK